MLFCGNKYLRLFLQKSVLSTGLILFFGLLVYCQDNPLQKDSFNLHLNPLLISTFKNPVKTNTLLNEHLKPTKNELMDWSAYYLTDEQRKERERKLNQPVYKQIANDIIDSYVNSLIYGKTKKPAAIPKF